MSTPTLYGPPGDARPVPVTQAQRLAAEAAAAAELRAYRTDPDVVALRVEHIRSQVDHLMWVGIVLGLCFTMTNVQTVCRRRGAGRITGLVVSVAAGPDGLAGVVGGAARGAGHHPLPSQHRRVAEGGEVGVAVGDVCDEHLGVLGRRIGIRRRVAHGGPAGGGHRRGGRHRPAVRPE